MLSYHAGTVSSVSVALPGAQLALYAIKISPIVFEFMIDILCFNSRRHTIFNTNHFKL